MVLSHFITFHEGPDWDDDIPVTLNPGTISASQFHHQRIRGEIIVRKVNFSSCLKSGYSVMKNGE